MAFVICIAELAAALVFIAAGFAYVFSPGTAKKLMKTAGLRLGMLLVCLIAAWEFMREHPFGALLAVLVMSPAVYVVRERRLHRPERPLKGGALERTPVAPHHLPEDEL